MRRIILGLILTLLAAGAAFSQNSTTVSINATDAGSVAWANGTYQFTFVGQAGASWPGGGLANAYPTTPGSLNGSGNASRSVPNNATINPGPSFFNLTVCPNPAVTTQGSGCFTKQYTISGATQTINIVPPAITIPVPTVSTQINPVVAYADAEIAGGWIGFVYNQTSGSGRVCTAVSNNTCSTWASYGSGGGGGTPCTTTALSFQYNNAGAFGCVPDLTFDGTHTITLGPSGIFLITGALNLSSATVTWPGTVVLTNQANAYSTGAQDFSSATSLKLPIGASLAPTTEALVGWDTTNHRPVFGNGTNTTFPTWITTAPTTGHCPQFSGTLGLLVDSGSANCGGLANPMTTLGDVLYGGASGVPTSLAGPTVAGTYSLLSKPSGGAATALTFGLPGVVTNAQVGTTYTYQQTDSVNDRAGFTTFANASAIAVTLPSAASFGSNWTNLSCDQLAGTATITPGTSTIDSYNPTAGTYTAATTTLVLTTGQCAFIYSDNTNYHAVKFTSSAGGAAALSALTAAVGTNTLANGNNPQLWNWAQTTNTQAGMTFGETSAATAGTLTGGLANQSNVSVSTATNSTATPFNVTQGSITNTVATPAAQIRATWNNGSLNGQGLIVAITNTASGSGSLPFSVLGGAGAATQLFTVNAGGTAFVNGNYNVQNNQGLVGANAGANVIVVGGQDGGNSGATSGGLTLRSADNSATGAATATGNLIVRAGDATGASGATIAGTTLLRPGQATSASGLQGMIWFAESFFGGGTNTLWNLQCESAAMTVNDCGASPTTVIGIAANATSPIVTVTYGVSPVNASASVTLGHTVCAGSTAGKVTDSGGLTACTLGTEVGIVMAVSGTYNLPTGGTVVLSTTLPLIHMKVD